jgi:phenylpropionate dioxygenase-like ring-hydroxylating dioxygenase large terminal subunit
MNVAVAEELPSLPVATGRKLTNWPDTLTDRRAFAREQSALSHVWTFLGHAQDVAKDGDWFRATLGTRSIFVQRFGDRLKGFENRCAHRSFPLRTADKGNGPIRCGFHHWRYNEEGRAVDIPECEPLFGVTPQEMGVKLVPVQVATCGALVFGRFQLPGDNETLEEFLGESFPIIEAMFSGPATPQFLSGEVAANWRLCFQIAVEDYHVPVVHAPVWGKHGYLKRERIGYFRFGRHSAFFTNADPDGFAKMAAECRAGTWRSANYRVFHIFPNLTVNHFHTDRDHWYVMAMQYVPVTPGRSLMRAWYGPAPFAANRAWHERWAAPVVDVIRRVAVRYYSHKVLKQDTAVCEKLQTIAQQIAGAPILGGLEERIGWFEEAYEKAMRAS